MSNVIYGTLKERLEKQGVVVNLTPESKIVIFSDLHMGSGRNHDDFIRNSKMFLKVLEEYYLKEGYTLILNGDVEELQRNTLESIYHRWGSVYKVLDEFHRLNRLFKIAGNHDSKLLSISLEKLHYPLLESLKLVYRGESIFVFHGHQLSIMFEKFNEILGFFLRYVANTLRIKNRSTAHDSRRRWKIEKRAYEFSRENKILSIIGHTHRPLFESFSKVDSLRYQIERVCREYVDRDEIPGGDVEKRIQALKEELNLLLVKKGKEDFLNQIYSKGIVVPCLFNSGSVIGKRGMTAVEIEGDTISLVHWTSFSNGENGAGSNPSRFPVPLETYHSEEYPFSDEPKLRRRIIKKDDLRYIFTRISLLS